MSELLLLTLVGPAVLIVVSSIALHQFNSLWALFAVAGCDDAVLGVLSPHLTPPSQCGHLARRKLGRLFSQVCASFNTVSAF